MATTPRPRSPSKPVTAAKNPQERAALERQWAEYRYNKQKWEQDEDARKRAELSRQQQAQKEQQKAAEYQRIQDRVKRQEGGDQSAMEQLGAGMFS